MFCYGFILTRRAQAGVEDLDPAAPWARVLEESGLSERLRLAVQHSVCLVEDEEAPDAHGAKIISSRQCAELPDAKSRNYTRTCRT